MQTTNDVHVQFADFFESDRLKPFAYLVSRKLAEGHTCLPLDQEWQFPGDPYLEKYAPGATIDDLLQEPQVARAGEAKQPFILHNNRLYLQRYFAYESAIVEKIRELITAETAEREQRLQLLIAHGDFIRSLSAKSSGQLLPDDERADWQQVAAVLGLLNNFTIITGGPGTGKTTTVAKILALLFTMQPGLKVALAAPTGKAAVRMAESLKSSRINASPEVLEKFKTLVPGTIHRLLRYIPGSPYFRHDANNPLVYDLVIVDEASMIDLALFAKLLAAIGPGTRIIFLGDKDQLASVEAGSLLGDLCQTQQQMNALPADTLALVNSFIPDLNQQVTPAYILSTNNPLAGHIIELKRSHRFTGEGGIGKLSRAIINGRLNEIAAFTDRKEDKEVLIDQEYSDERFNAFITGYTRYIHEANVGLALDQLNQLRVLCAVREGPQGVNTVNSKIETWLVKKKLITINGEFYENRPIIVTRNYPELGLFNGDVGIIRSDENGSLKAWFEDSDKTLRAVLPGYITSAETVFAMTIHKSQGSEYNQVMVLLPTGADQPLLTRELLYTAITRAKQFVLLQATYESIIYTAGRKVERASGIMERFGSGDG